MIMRFEDFKIKIYTGQRRIAAALQRHFDKLTPFKKKLSVFLFISVFSVLSLKIVLDAIRIKSTEKQFSKINLIRPQKNLGEKFINPIASIDTITFLKVERFKKWMDSLAEHDSIGYRNLIKIRPHFIDSISLFEEYYLSQRKK